MASCPICQSIEYTPVFIKNGFNIISCTKCGLQYVWPIPSDTEIQQHYQNPAYFKGTENQGYFDYGAMRKALDPHFRRRLAIINSNQPSGRYLLDFGCAEGFFLEIAQEMGWEVTGVELSESMVQKTNQRLGVPVFTSLDLLQERCFDVITFWEVIEHLSHLMETLQNLYNHLCPGGLLMLSTPNTGHWQAVNEPENWSSYCPPSHLLFFTINTLTRALQEAGFENIAVQRSGPLPPLPTWLYRMSAPLRQSLFTGQAKQWMISLMIWRLIRLFGWGWQRLAHPTYDIFATLEATARKSAKAHMVFKVKSSKG